MSQSWNSEKGETKLPGVLEEPHDYWCRKENFCNSEKGIITESHLKQCHIVEVDETGIGHLRALSPWLLMMMMMMTTMMISLIIATFENWWVVVGRCGVTSRLDPEKKPVPPRSEEKPTDEVRDKDGLEKSEMAARNNDKNHSI